ncbi:hypothetical protein BGZ68_009895 [Mortierella alpina]|nr:hypothetical protein BGZ68_009895 [Mortierella alpina]
MALFLTSVVLDEIRHVVRHGHKEILDTPSRIDDGEFFIINDRRGKRGWGSYDEDF